MVLKGKTIADGLRERHHIVVFWKVRHFHVPLLSPEVQQLRFDEGSYFHIFNLTP